MNKKRQNQTRAPKKVDLKEINQVFKTLGLEDESVRDSLANLRAATNRKQSKQQYQIRLSHTSDYVFGT